MRFCKAANSPPPDHLSGMPKMPKRKNSSVATITISFQPKFLFMTNARPIAKLRDQKCQSSFRRLFSGGDRCHRAPAHFEPQIVGRNPQMDVLILQRNDGAA